MPSLSMGKQTHGFPLSFSFMKRCFDAANCEQHLWLTKLSCPPLSLPMPVRVVLLADRKGTAELWLVGALLWGVSAMSWLWPEDCAVFNGLGSGSGKVLAQRGELGCTLAVCGRELSLFLTLFPISDDCGSQILERSRFFILRPFPWLLGRVHNCFPLLFCH